MTGPTPAEGKKLRWPAEADEPLRAGLHRLVSAVADRGGAIGYLTPPGRDQTDAWLDDVLTDVRAGDGALAVAGAGGQVTGCALWRRRRGAQTYRHTAELQQVMTHPGVRGGGLGRLLVTAVLESARAAGLEQITLGVRGTNRVAIGLYERLGFREWGRLPDGIAVGDDRFDDVKMHLVFGR